MTSSSGEEDGQRKKITLNVVQMCLVLQSALASSVVRELVLQTDVLEGSSTSLTAEMISRGAWIMVGNGVVLSAAPLEIVGGTDARLPESVLMPTPQPLSEPAVSKLRRPFAVVSAVTAHVSQNRVATAFAEIKLPTSFLLVIHSILLSSAQEVVVPEEEVTEVPSTKNVKMQAGSLVQKTTAV